MVMQPFRVVTIIVLVSAVSACSGREQRELYGHGLVRSTAAAGGVIPVEIYTVASDAAMQSYAVILQEKSKDRFLPIVIGVCEANAIASHLNGVKTPRPMTHDLLRNILDELHIEAKRVVVDDFDESTYLAKVILVKDGSLYEIDARPSDAIALAVRASIPIYVAQKVMERNAIGPDAKSPREESSPAKEIEFSPGKRI
jgi:bifunctional DNase/RNase